MPNLQQFRPSINRCPPSPSLPSPGLTCRVVPGRQLQHQGSRAACTVALLPHTAAISRAGSRNRAQARPGKRAAGPAAPGAARQVPCCPPRQRGAASSQPAEPAAPGQRLMQAGHPCCPCCLCCAATAATGAPLFHSHIPGLSVPFGPPVPSHAMHSLFCVIFFISSLLLSCSLSSSVVLCRGLACFQSDSAKASQAVVSRY